MSRLTRILGLDHGTRRIGAAISDPERRMAFALEVYEPRGEVPDTRHYREIVAENDVDRIVIGLPVHTTGREGDRALAARRFGAWLEAATGVPVVYFDERFSTQEAEELLLEVGLTRKRRKSLRDQLAARIILQSYLDAGSPLETLTPGPLDDRSEGSA